MPKTKIVLDHKGIDSLLKSTEVSGYVSEIAQQVASKCGAGYETDTYTTPSRVVSSVYTDDAAAARDNIENNTLLKAVST